MRQQSVCLPVPILRLFVVFSFIMFGRGAAQDVPDKLANEAKAMLSHVHGSMRVPGLQQPVTVLRDRWGVAHVYAQNQHDLFFAQGFVAAQDRLFQMELWRRSGQGKLA